MQSEIKAAIEREAEKFANKNSVLDKEPFPYGWGFTCGAEYGYKLAEEKLEIAVKALKELNKHLTIPAAEYVPAIPEAWTIIDKALKELGE